MKARQQSGFTLIELVMVIVILGILSAVAIPQFVNLKGEASIAAAEGVAGSLGSASAINFALRTANGAAGIAVTNDLAGCQAHSALLQGGALPSGFSIGFTSPNCTVTHTDGGSATWTAVVIP